MRIAFIALLFGFAACGDEQDSRAELVLAETWSLAPHTTSGVAVVAADPGGHWVFTADVAGDVRRWNALTGDVSQEPFARAAEVTAMSASEGVCATGSASGAVFVHTEKGSTRLTAGSSAVRCLFLSADAKLLAAGFADGSCELWSISSRTRVERWEGRGHPVHAIDVHEERVMAVDSLGLRGLGVTTLLAPVRGARCAAWPPDRSWVAVGCADGCVRAYRCSDGQALWSWQAHATEVRHIALDGKFVATGTWTDALSFAPNVVVWTLEGRQVWQKEFGLPASLCMANDLLLLADGARLPHVLVTATGARRWESGFIDSVTSIDVSPNGELIAIAGASGDVVVRRPGDRRLQHVLEGHAGCVNRVRFAPDGQTLASASWDTTIRLWNLQTGTARVLAAAADVEEIAWSGDGRYLAAGTLGCDSPDELVVWDASLGQAVARREVMGPGLAIGPGPRCTGAELPFTLRSLPSLERKVQLDTDGELPVGVAVQPGGESLAVSTAGDRLLLYSIADRERKPRRSRGMPTTRGIAFDATGRWLISIHEEEGLVRLWGVDRLEVEATVRMDAPCDVVVRGNRVWVAGDRTIRAFTIRAG